MTFSIPLMITIAVVFAVGIAFLLSAAARANKADWGDALSNHLDGLMRLFVSKYHRLQADYIALPEKGPALVVANHISGLDPLLLMASCKRPLHFLIAQEEYERPGLRWLFDRAGAIPVARTTRPERALRAALRALDEGKVIALFPFGRMHLDTEAPLKIKGGVGVLAARSGATVYPARIERVAVKKSVVRAVLRRGHPKLYPLKPMQVEEKHVQVMLARLGKALTTPVEERT